ncbi:MAG: condensation domain-containing protein, partial [Terracidiphilus sp.]
MHPSSEIQDEDAPPLSLSQAKLALLQQRLCGISNSAAEHVEPRAPGEAVPISVDQYRIWFHAETAPGVPLYNEAITLHRKGSFDAAIFHAAFNEILRRHEAWRSSFTQTNGELAQIVHSDLKVCFPLSDLADLLEQDREAAALEIAGRDARRPIALDKAPLMRGHIVRMAEDEHRVYLTLHHILFDGVSIYRILMPELMTIYAAYAAGLDHSLPEPALQYGDYAVWRRRQTRSSAMARQLAYWKENLSGELPVLALPADRPRPAWPSGRGSMECFQISNELIDALRVVGHHRGVTLYMVLLAAYKAMLFRLSGQQDLVIGGASDARRQPELEGMMGYMLETIPIRTRPSSSTPFSQFLLEVRDSVLGALAASEVPFDEIVKAVGGHRGNHSPIFQAFFSIEPPAPAFVDGWDLTQMDVSVGAAKFDLYLELDERPEALACRFLYNTDIFDAATIRRMADHWRVILESLPEDPDRLLGSLPILTAAEIAQRLGPGGWNDTKQDFLQRPLHALIQAQARRTPHAAAVVDGEDTWTYVDLMSRVDELSAGLLAAGVKRGDLVAVHLQRTADLVAGLLAILQAGAAYMPLEPEAPSARLALLIDNAMPKFILADSSAPNLLLSLHSAVLLVEELAREGRGTASCNAESVSDDVAYVINTSGTTGIPKGVEITHRSLVNALLSFQKQPGFTARDRMLGITTISFDIAGLELFLPLISGGTLILESRAVALDTN